MPTQSKLAPNVFTRAPDGAWLPGLYARGPFEGVQGGAVAAVMASAIEQSCEGFVASVTTHFLKAVSLVPLQVTVRPLRAGRRVSVIDAELTAAGGLVAVQRATVIVPRNDTGLPTPRRCVVRPEILPLETRSAPHGGPWMMDTMEVRLGGDGVMWFRQRTPLFEPMSALGRVLAAADWAHGLTPPLGAEVRPPAAIPNTDLTVHLLRAPQGPWVGVKAATAWSEAAVGAGWASLHDVEGLIGRVAMSVAVTPLPEESR